MTKTRSTKRALAMSALAILLCVSMLVGSTFAWFTDSVTSTGNIIKSGDLDVEMFWADGKEDPASATWQNAAEGAIFNYELWEPGYTVVRHIKIDNVGSLAFKYQLNILANGEVSKLADVIDVYFVDPAVQVANRAALADQFKVGTLSDILAGMPTNASGKLLAGKSTTVTLALKMQETAGNEYKKLEIGSSFSIQLLATQLTSEVDSFDEMYDEDAALGTYIELNEGDDLMAVLASAEANKPITIKLLGDVEIPTGPSSDIADITPASSVVINGNGKTITAIGSGVTPIGDKDAPVTIKNANIIDNSVSYAETAWEFSYCEFGGVINFENVHFADSIMVDGTSATFVNCSFVGHNDKNTGTTQYAVWVYNGDATFTNCTVTGTRGIKTCDQYAGEVGTVVIDGCTFTNLTEKPGLAIDDRDTQDMKVIIKNSTFINCQAGDQGLYIYETDNAIPTLENNTVLNNVKFISTPAELVAFGNTSVNGILYLTADLDMTGYDMQPIMLAGGADSELTFLGNGHTISNLNLVQATQNGMSVAAMFNVMYSGKAINVSDLTIKNATSISSKYAAVVVSYNSTSTVEINLNNVDVDGATITAETVAPLVGYTTYLVNLTGCDVSNITLTGEKAEKMGAYVGTANTATCVVNATACTNNTGYNDCGRVINGATYN